MVKKRAIRNLFSSLCSFAFGVTSTLRRALSFINPRVQGEVKVPVLRRLAQELFTSSSHLFPLLEG